MPEEYLQAAFEIKASCDEISRKLLRWHWESRPGPHSFDALLDHIRRRQEESPAYYGHMPDVGRKTGWQQLDTTICMRVLLDPESDAAAPLDLLGQTAHPGAARRACNAVRTARNEAAHASDRAGGGQAAILFDEAVECVEDAYAGTALSGRELEEYYRLSNDYLRRCGVGGKEAAPPPEQPAPEVHIHPTGEARQKAAARRKAEEGRQPSPQKQPAPRGGDKAAPKQPRGGQSAPRRGGRGKAAPRQRQPAVSRAALAALAAALLIGLAARAAGMGLLPF
ncbi:MAG TPA: hypothetical protein H9771_05730 [Candidatus Faecalibacterium faecipullorum]|uniref:Uncharacterized protein n=1 Tax=Candidatus Faecalibacterium faecipullorum TaxID=2838578 RepID=A0A9D2MFR0_9FIRM|nr:hypothetical protein [Candidatus Faecalibacterium faecipullorum]